MMATDLIELLEELLSNDGDREVYFESCTKWKIATVERAYIDEDGDIVITNGIQPTSQEQVS